LKPQSAKAKGRKLQQYVRDEILAHFDELESDDVRSTSMGASGEDVQLSPKARNLLPWAIEAKARAKINACRFYDQAAEHAEGRYQPVVVMRENHGKSLAIVDFQYLLHIMRVYTYEG